MNAIASFPLFSFIKKLFAPRQKEDPKVAALFTQLFNAEYSNAGLKKFGLTDKDVTKCKALETHNDYSRLFGKTWLNDNCVNEHIRHQIKDKTDFCFIHSLIPLHKVKKPYAPFEDTKITKLFGAKKMLFCPLNVAESHWALLAVDLKARVFRYYDSLSYKPEDAKIQAVRAHIQKIADAEKVTLSPNDFQLSIEKCPQQENGYDCGVFVLMAVHHLVSNKPLDYSQKDAPFMRLKALSDFMPSC